jgi:hypothetical protein
LKKVKSVAFNIADPIEYALYQYALENKYFSTYIKRLIQRDMESGQKIDLSKYMEGHKVYLDKETKKDTDEES